MRERYFPIRPLVNNLTRFAKYINESYGENTRMAAEFRHVGLNLPRQVGKTRAIAEMARGGDLIITRNLHLKSEYSQYFSPLTRDVKPMVLHAGEVENFYRGKRMGPMHPMTVYLDEVTEKKTATIEAVVRGLSSARSGFDINMLTFISLETRA